MTVGELEGLFGYPDSASVVQWTYGPDDLSGPTVSVYSGKVNGWSKPESRRRSDSAAQQLDWPKLREGMSEADVLELLGHPDSVSVVEWKYGDELSGPAVTLYSGRVRGWR